MRGRLGFEERPYPQATLCHATLAAARAVTLSDQERAGLDGLGIGHLIKTKRIAAIATITTVSI